MTSTLFRHATLVLHDRLESDAGLLCRDGRIEAVLASAEAREVPADEVVDAQGCFLAPAFIDLHIHGLGPHLFNNGPDHLRQILRDLPRFGVAGVLPTVFPVAKGGEPEMLAALAEAAAGCPGAEVLGFHLEGPFLTLGGALPPTDAQRYGSDWARAMIAAAAPLPAVFSVAPEHPLAPDLLPLLTEGGRPAFITHTAASVEETRQAIQLGARHATHFFDVFPSPPETDPGVRPCGAVEAILADDRTSVDFILDGVHVHPVAVELALAALGRDRVSLISDANIGAGMPPGRFRFGSQEVEFAEAGAPARLTESSNHPGALAGSGLTMDRAVRNAVRFLDVDLPTAVAMASANPARVLGLAGCKGRIAPGFNADLVLLDDALEVCETRVRAVRRYAR